MAENYIDRDGKNNTQVLMIWSTYKWLKRPDAAVFTSQERRIKIAASPNHQQAYYKGAHMIGREVSLLSLMAI